MRLGPGVAGPGRGLAVDAYLHAWTPADLGAAFIFEGLAENATTSGSNITALANPGTAGAMTSGATSCTLDSSVLVGGKGAIRTSSTSSDLHVASGGPTGTQAFSVYALAQIVSQPGAGQQDSDYFTLGNPGNDATHKQYGLGCVAASNGAWQRVGGFGNTSLQGPSATRMIYDSNLRLFKLSSSGSLVKFAADGGLIASGAIAVTLDTSGAFGYRGPYPLASYGPPDTRSYGVWVFGRELTAAEEALFFRYVARKFTYTPAMFISTTGDSRTAGHITDVNTTSYGELMVSQASAGGSTIYVKNDGVSSQSSAVIRARVEAAGFFDSFAPAGFRKQRMIIRFRTNDPSAGITPAQGYDNACAINVLAQARGIKTIMSTEHGTTAYGQPERDVLNTFNQLVLANSGGFDAVADIRPLIANYLTTNPTSTDMPVDGGHQSDALLAQEAAIYLSTIATLT